MCGRTCGKLHHNPSEAVDGKRALKCLNLSDDDDAPTTRRRRSNKKNRQIRQTYDINALALPAIC